MESANVFSGQSVGNKHTLGVDAKEYLLKEQVGH